MSQRPKNQGQLRVLSKGQAGALRGDGKFRKKRAEPPFSGGQNNKMEALESLNDRVPSHSETRGLGSVGRKMR